MMTTRFRVLTGLIGIAIAPAAAVAQPVNLLAPAIGAPALPASASAAAMTSAPQANPAIAATEPARVYLAIAKAAITRSQYGDAEQALEQAETRLLNLQSGAPSGTAPWAEPAILDIRRARYAVRRHDTRQAAEAVNEAESALTTAVAVEATQPAASPPLGGPSGRSGAAPPPVPSVTYALLPGHWQLQGATTVWVPPETTLRRVEDRRFVDGHYVWRGGNWAWVPPHYAGSAGE